MREDDSGPFPDGLVPVRHSFVSLLGPAEVCVDGAAVHVAGRGERALLSLLALDVGRRVSVDRLVDALWEGDAAPANPINALQTRVSKLRRSIGAVLVTEPGGYRLDLPSAAVDVHRFRDLVARGRPRDALALWRGPALAEFAGAYWADVEIAALDEEWLRTTEDRIDDDLVARRHAELVPELERLVAVHPGRERLWAQLMLSLYRCSRQVDALATFARARRVLDEDFGLQPGARLTALERAILRQDPELRPPPASATPTRPPSPIARLVGRSDDLARCRRSLSTHRLVTLVGTGGVGKSRLAFQVANDLAGHHADGAAVVRVADVRESDHLVGAVATAVGVGDAERRGVHSLDSWFAPRDLLLVLDSCEHLAGAVVELVSHLLDVAPHLRVLATSRISLRVDGAQELPVNPLAPGAARELFIERAGDATGRPLVSADLPHVGAIVDRVDRLPLAIELAAAWLRSLSVATVATRLADDLDLLDQRVTTSAPHPLREVVARSLDLLSGPQAIMFERLAVFSGGWTLEDAEAVCGGGLERHEVIALLAGLAQQSLVVVEQERYRMLAAIEELARERLASSGADDGIRYAHARHFLAMAGGAEAGLRGPQQAVWLEGLLASASNISGALAWARRDDRIHADEVLLAAAGLGWFWFLGRHGDGRRELAAALEATSNASPWARARALQAQSIVGRPGGCIVHPHPQADGLALMSRDLLSAAGDQPAARLSAVMAAVPAVGGTDRHGALRTLADAAEAFRRQGDRWAAALADFVTMEIEVHQGSIDDAVEVGERARDGFEQVGDAWGTSSVALHLGHGLRLTGRYDEAASLLESGREEATRVGLRNTLTGIHVDLARLALHEGDTVAARRSVDRVRSLAGDLGNRMLVGMAEVLDAALQLERGRLDLAGELTRAALSRFEDEDVPGGMSEALCLTAWLEARRGDLGAAQRHARRAGDVARAIGDRGFEARALEVTSLVLALRGDRDGATTALGRAGTLRLDGNRPASRTEAMVIDELTDALDDVAR